MNAKLLAKALDLVGEAADLPPSERSDFYARQCKTDPGLLPLVEQLEAAPADDRSPMLDDDLDRLATLFFEETAADPLPGTIAGNYLIEELIGAGGMGRVYRAVHSGHEGVVALKVLRRSFSGVALSNEVSDHEHTLARLQAEAKLLARCRHSGVVQVIDLDHLPDGTPYFVMEYVDGVPITDYCAQMNASFHASLSARLALFRDVSSAVAAAHAVGVIHRDLKPSNILVRRDGVVKLVDFGIAEALTSENDADRDTDADTDKDHENRGGYMSIAYAAPENGGQSSIEGDVYSLGILLAELLLGQLPFAQEHNPRRLRSAILAYGLPPLLTLFNAKQQPWLRRLSRLQWAELEAICAKAANRDPAQRYSAVKFMEEDVARLLGHRPVRAFEQQGHPKWPGAPSSSKYRIGRGIYRSSRFLVRNAKPVVAASLALALIIGVVVFYTVRLAHARDAALAEAARVKRIQRFMQDMLGGADTNAAPGQDLKVITLLDRSAREAALLKADPETQSELFLTLGTMYNRLSRFDEADRLLSLSLKQVQQTKGPKSLEAAAVLLQLGTSLADQGKTKEAEEYVTNAIEIQELRRVPPNDPTAMDAQYTLGRVRFLSTDYTGAIKILNPIAQMKPPYGDAEAHVVRNSLSALTMAQMSAGYYAQAETSSKPLLAMDRELFGEEHASTSEDLLNLASINFYEGNFIEAETLYRHCISILQKLYGPDNPDVLTFTTVLARDQMAQRKYDEANTTLHGILEKQIAIYGVDHQRVAYTLATLGEIENNRAKFAEAESALERALAIDRRLFGDNNQNTAMIKSSLGLTYTKQKKYSLAETILREALKTLEALPKGNTYIGVTRTRYGDCLLADKRYGEAKDQLILALEELQEQPKPPTALIADAQQSLQTAEAAAPTQSEKQK